MKNKVISVLMLFWGISLFSATIEVTLSQAIDLALKNNPSVKIVKSEMKIDKAKKMQIRSLLFPQVNMVSKYFNTNHLPTMYPLAGMDVPVFDDTGAMTGDHITMHPMAPYANNTGMAYRTDINLMYPIFTGGKRKNALKSINKLYQSNISELNEKKSLLTFNVTKVFYNIQFLNRVIDVYHNALSLYDKHLKLAKKAYDEGVRSEFDILRFESKIEEFKAEIVDIEGKRAVARIGLANLLALSSEDTLICKASENYPTIKDSVKMDANSLNSIIATNWKIKMLDDKMSALSFKKKINKAQKLPMLFAFGNYNITHNMDFPPFDEAWHDSYALGVGFKFDIFDGNKTNGEIAETNATMEKIKYYREGLELKLRIELQKSYAHIKALYAEKKAMEKNLNVVKKAMDIVTVGYDNGVNTNIELNDIALKEVKVKTGIAKIDKEINIERSHIAYLKGKIGLS